MTQEIKRVIVPLDASSETGTAIDTAVRLAARWQALLHGVFVEDEELIGLTGLPFARQVTLGAGREALTKEHVEDQLRAFAERARRDLAAAAERHDVKWSFETVRGPLVPDALGDEDDFFVAGAESRPIGHYFRIASRWWSAIVARPFLLAKRDWKTGGSVLTLLRRRDPPSARTLDIAAQIASFGSGTLTVAATPDVPGSGDFSAWVSGLLAGRPLKVQTEPASLDPSVLRQRIIELDCRLLVLEVGERDTQPDELRELVEQLDCDVLIIREPRGRQSASVATPTPANQL
jgi:nucleotide-binding universal stress UspA family protein